MKNAFRAALVISAILQISDARAQQKPISVHMAVVSQTAFTSLPVTVAQELGFFRDEHLEVTLNDVQGPSRAIEALASHSADVGAAILDNLIVAASQGKHFQSFVLMTNSPGLAIAVSPASEQTVRIMRDLEGKTVGVPTLGSTSEIFARYAAFRQGVPPDAIQFVQAGSPAARTAALEANRINAAVLSEPAISILRKKYGHLLLLADTRTPADMRGSLGTPDYPGTVVFSTPEWIEQNAAAAKAIARAVVRAQKWLHTASASEIAARMPAFMKPDPEAFMEGLTTSIPSYSLDGRLSIKSIRKVNEILIRFSDSVRSHPVDLNSLFTNQYLPGK